ncbi:MULTISPECIES: DUF6199 family natural product biosynthesis protein [unclassified Paenibacillus]|uniref:DUF6199 family natural product biosynthesis protein n=1 Tax=unclassified Paenibacillus TaxID=185978 RepID=UPI000838D6BA|nr:MULTISPECIES: DUF6199 family natural product biosynthesis protein [unclassified Paenibacillus]NWL88877.1 hypothetical protein [Paenibacillus sp. 79R4]
MNWIIAVLCIALGAMSALFPGSAWYLSYGWRYRDHAPSQAALVTQRIGGILLSLIGLAMIAVSCSS